MDEVLHVSCAAQGRYIRHSAAMLHSVLAHSGERRVHVHYLHAEGLPARSAELLAAMVDGLGGSISFLEIDEARVAGLPDVPPFTRAMWHRIYLPELLPDVNRVLYLDVDAIAADSLDALWETDVEGQWLAAVTNVFQHNHVHRPAELGLAGPHVYFNSGVMLMNLDQMRRDECTAALRDYAIREGGRLEWPDQDALNVVLGERRVALHPRWNCMNSVLNFPSARDVFGDAAVDEARARPGIRHFEGPSINKPWHALCEQPLRELYFAHRRQTPWPDCELDGGSRRGLLRRLGLGRRREAAAISA